MDKMRSLEKIVKEKKEIESQMQEIAKHFGKEEMIYIRKSGYLEDLQNRLAAHREANQQEEMGKMDRQIKEQEETMKNLLFVLKNPDVTKYLTFKKELQNLQKEHEVIYNQELDNRKNEFTQTIYNPIMNNVTQEIDSAYKRLSGLLQKPEFDQKEFGMAPKATIDKLSFQEKNNIETQESKIFDLEKLQTEIMARYKRVIASKNLSALEEAI